MNGQKNKQKDEIMANHKDFQEISSDLSYSLGKCMAPGVGFEPTRPEGSQAVRRFLSASPGLLPTWLGDPGTR
jgi:hypothetical protein